MSSKPSTSRKEQVEVLLRHLLAGEVLYLLLAEEVLPQHGEVLPQAEELLLMAEEVCPQHGEVLLAGELLGMVEELLQVVAMVTYDLTVNLPDTDDVGGCGLGNSS